MNRGLTVGRISFPDVSDEDVVWTRAVTGSTVAALAVAIAYGLAGRFTHEVLVFAPLVGTVSGLSALRFGQGRSIPVGMIAAVVSLLAVIGAKVVVGAPSGVSWFTQHTTVFDLVFCYVLNPLAALFCAATDSAKNLVARVLP
jgi:hypothetical protein